jgi:hypothetical protein
MRGVLARASSGDRPVRHRPAHAMPSGRMKRIRIRGRDRTRHARVSFETLAERRQRLAHAPRIADWVVAFVGSHLSARHWGVRPVRTRAFRVALFICVVGAGFITAAPSLSPGDGTLRANNVTHRPPPETATDPMASRFRISDQPPKGAAPATASAPSVSAPQKDNSPRSQGGLSLDMQITTAPAPDDPDLEQALSGLDRQADLEQLMWHQRGLGDQPPTGPAAGPPGALPDGHAPGPPQSSTSATGLPPQSSPSTSAAPNAPNAKHSGTRRGQPTSSIAAVHRGWTTS